MATGGTQRLHRPAEASSLTDSRRIPKGHTVRPHGNPDPAYTPDPTRADRTTAWGAASGRVATAAVRPGAGSAYSEATRPTRECEGTHTVADRP